MPFTVNGVGTTYFGKKNKNAYQGTCEFCGQPSQLVDYDTMHCICLLFIPIIPLGRKRILGQCNHCRQHRVLKLRDWENSVESALTDAMLRMKQNPEDLEAAIELHQTFHQAGKQQQAAEIARLIKERFSRDFEAHFYLSTWYEVIGRPDEARKSMKRAYELAPDNPIAKRGMAIVLIQERQLDRAEKFLEDMGPESELYDPGIFFMLARGFQEAGNHEKAHRLFSQLHKQDPEISRSQDFSQAVRKTEKQVASPARILKPTPLYQRPWVIGLVFVFFVVGLIAFGSFYKKGNRPVFVVNGLPQPIDVLVDDELVRVPPQGKQEISVSEGEHTVTLQAPAEEAKLHQSYKFKIESNFFSRLTDDTVTVLDPSESTVYTRLVEFYSNDENIDFLDRSMKASSIIMFEKLKQFEDIDYPFEEFPEEIEVSTRNINEIHQKTGLSLIEGGAINTWNLLDSVGTSTFSEKAKLER
ncbi:MAG: tetratricopeptide repeat protein, partial [Planctomycetaceae bacterium]|nr:tetratricopeptide repeat protein [Planctomycetaceae bacterium]